MPSIQKHTGLSTAASESAVHSPCAGRPVDGNGVSPGRIYRQSAGGSSCLCLVRKHCGQGPFTDLSDAVVGGVCADPPP